MLSRTTTRVSAAAASSGDLPPVCVVTGMPTDFVLGLTFTWVPSWTWILLLFGILPCLVARAYTAQKIPCFLPVAVSARARYRSVRRGMVIGGASAVLLFVVSAAIQTPAVAWVGAIVLAAAAVAWVWLIMWFVTVEPASEPQYLVIRRAHDNFATAARV